MEPLEEIAKKEKFSERKKDNSIVGSEVYASSRIYQGLDILEDKSYMGKTSIMYWM